MAVRHLVVSEYGHFLGLRSACVVVKHEGTTLRELPLNRLSTITIAKRGVSVSSDLLLACSARGIRLFMLDWRGATVSALTSTSHHATVRAREAQFQYRASLMARTSAQQIVSAKLANQRAVLKYFAKYHGPKDGPLHEAAEVLTTLKGSIKLPGSGTRPDWRPRLLGAEGAGAAAYFGALRQAKLLPESFEKRTGRGATEVTNAALNFGYAMLQTRVWSTLVNAGLEPFAGILHEDRPGRPALVLDLMEEHRAFLVDRVVITLRQLLERRGKFDDVVRARLVQAVGSMFTRRIAYRGRRLRIETVLQRQAYRLAGAFHRNKAYRPIRYAW